MMKHARVGLIIILLFTSLNLIAKEKVVPENPNEPKGGLRVGASTPVYYDAAGFDTMYPCDPSAAGEASGSRKHHCLERGQVYSCGQYTYLTDKKSRRSLQFCQMKTTVYNSDNEFLNALAKGEVQKDSLSSFYVATGFIDENGKYIENIPAETQLYTDLRSAQDNQVTGTIRRGKPKSEIQRVMSLIKGETDGSTMDFYIDKSYEDMIKSKTTKPEPVVVAPIVPTKPATAADSSTTTPKPTQAKVEQKPNPVLPVEAGVCAPGMSCYEEKKNSSPLADVLKKAVSSGRGLGPSFSPLCEKFINTNGSYGNLGRRLASEFDKPEYAIFTADSTFNISGIKEVCPQFKVLTKEQRKFFWVWTFAAIAQRESTCGFANKAIGVDTVAAGLFQLNAPHSNRRARTVSLRKVMGNRTAYGYCLPKNIYPDLDNTLCAMDMMLGHLAGQYGDPKLLKIDEDDQKTYWHQLNLGVHGDIPGFIKELQICQKK